MPNGGRDWKDGSMEHHGAKDSETKNIKMNWLNWDVFTSLKNTILGFDNSRRKCGNRSVK